MLVSLFIHTKAIYGSHHSFNQSNKIYSQYYIYIYINIYIYIIINIYICSSYKHAPPIDEKAPRPSISEGRL